MRRFLKLMLSVVAYVNFIALTASSSRKKWTDIGLPRCWFLRFVNSFWTNISEHCLSSLTDFVVNLDHIIFDCTEDVRHPIKFCCVFLLCTCYTFHF